MMLDQDEPGHRMIDVYEHVISCVCMYNSLQDNSRHLYEGRVMNNDELTRISIRVIIDIRVVCRAVAYMLWVFELSIDCGTTHRPLAQAPPNHQLQLPPPSGAAKHQK